MKCAVITPVGPGHDALYRASCRPSIEAAVATSKGPFSEIIPLMMDDTQGLHGRSARRNDALQQALSEGIDWVFFLDADDLLSPLAFEAFGRTLELDPDLEGAWGLICEIDEAGDPALRETQVPEIGSYEQLLGVRPYNSIQIGAFIRTEVAARAGFDTAIDTGEDFKFYYDIWSKHRCRKVPEIFFINRRGQHSTGPRSATGQDWVHAVDRLWTERLKQTTAYTWIEHNGVPARMRLTNPRDYIQAEHLEGRFFEKSSLVKLQDLLRERGVTSPAIAEVGANIGNHAVFYAQHLSPSKIYPVEPNPVAIDLLLENIACNGIEDLIDTRGIGFGAGRTAGTFTASTENADNLGATSLLADDQGTLKVLPLDELLAGVRIDFMKMDVEGMEIEALEGAAQLIRDSRPVIWVEVLKKNVMPFMRKWLPANGYRIADTVHYHHTTDFFVVPE